LLASKLKDAKACDERRLLIQLKSSMGVGAKLAQENCKQMKTSQIQTKTFCDRRNLTDWNALCLIATYLKLDASKKILG